MSVRRALAAALLVPVALLSACTDDEPVPKMPDPTTSPSPTETSSTAAPETPEDFIRRWQAAIDDMQTTGETAQFREMNHGCQPCSSLVKQVEAAYDSGGTIKTRGSVVQKVAPASSAGDAFDATVKFSPVVVSGADPVSYPGGVQIFRVTLDTVGGEMKVTDYRALAQ